MLFGSGKGSQNSVQICQLFIFGWGGGGGGYSVRSMLYVRVIRCITALALSIECSIYINQQCRPYMHPCLCACAIVQGGMSSDVILSAPCNSAQVKPEVPTSANFSFGRGVGAYSVPNFPRMKIL